MSDLEVKIKDVEKIYVKVFSTAYEYPQYVFLWRNKKSN